MTLTQEVEAVINSRPLMYIDDDINSQEPLTPAHFISVNTKTGIPDIEIEYSPQEDLSTTLLDVWKKGQAHINRFWKVWSDEYLQSLREKHSLKMKPVKGEVNRIPCIGEIVIIKEEGMPRGRWKIARIIELILSDIDGMCRAANLRTANGSNIKRPLRLLYPLEGSIDQPNAFDMKDSVELKVKELDHRLDNVERPKRKAAQMAREKIRNLSD